MELILQVFNFHTLIKHGFVLHTMVLVPLSLILQKFHLVQALGGFILAVNEDKVFIENTARQTLSRFPSFKELIEWLNH